MNRIALTVFWGHIPVFALVAFLCGTSVVSAVLFSTFVMIGATFCYKTLNNPRHISVVYGFVAMAMSAILIYFGQSAMQIEMHFHVFVFLALLAVFANPLAIVVAAVTVAVHHLLFYFLVPRGVFNYDASIYVVLVHALFVVLESVASVFIARSFFDNVIGLEKIVAVRTSEVIQKNEQMKRIMDNAEQGFLTVSADGKMESEHSQILETWFGEFAGGNHFWKYLGKAEKTLGDRLEFAWSQIVDDVLPIDMAIEQLPDSCLAGDRNLHFSYKPILSAAGNIEKMLIVVSDETAKRKQERLEKDFKENMKIFQHINNDKAGFLEFVAEAEQIIEGLKTCREVSLKKRLIHTLKGNSAVYGLSSIAEFCHSWEASMECEEELPQAQEALAKLWNARLEAAKTMLGEKKKNGVFIFEREYITALDSVRKLSPGSEIEKIIGSWRLEPIDVRLERAEEQVNRLAERLGKKVSVEVKTDGGRVDGQFFSKFWSSLVHVIRNAIDHGLESPEERAIAGKPSEGRVTLKSTRDKDSIVIEVSDDGRGINWKKVQEKARKMNLPHATSEELLDALFADGLSTKEEVSDISGRGVGMSAVKQECQARGIVISVQTAENKGTTFCFRLPAA